jgi:Uri superfamily endonuclease
MKGLVPPGSMPLAGHDMGFGDIREEKVDHPSHYNAGEMEVIDVIDGLGHTEGFCIGNIIKYVSRYRHKNGVQDLEKAKWYIDYLIKKENEK